MVDFTVHSSLGLSLGVPGSEFFSVLSKPRIWHLWLISQFTVPSVLASGSPSEFWVPSQPPRLFSGFHIRFQDGPLVTCRERIHSPTSGKRKIIFKMEFSRAYVTLVPGGSWFFLGKSDAVGSVLPYEIIWNEVNWSENHPGKSWSLSTLSERLIPTARCACLFRLLVNSTSELSLPNPKDSLLPGADRKSVRGRVKGGAQKSEVEKQTISIRTISHTKHVSRTGTFASQEIFEIHK